MCIEEVATLLVADTPFPHLLGQWTK